MMDASYGITSCCRDCIHAHVNEIRLDHLPPAPDGSIRLPHEFFWIDRPTWLAGMMYCAAFDHRLPYPHGWLGCCRKQVAPATSG